MSSAVHRTGIRAMQGIKDQVATIKSLKDSSKYGSSSRQFSGATESTGFKTDKMKQVEESFRTVMYLSCWGPN